MRSQDPQKREHLSMEIRKAGLEDAMAIATVHVRSWKAAYPGQIPQGYLDSLHPEDRVDGWQQVLAGTDWPREGVFLLVDTSDNPDAGSSAGAVVGFSHICPTRDDDLDPQTTGEITSIYLAPEVWSGGYGVQLMEASIDEMVTAQYDTATLWALDTNARARRFYEIGGWKEDGVTKVHDWGTFTCIDVRYLLDLRGRRGAQPGSQS
ncbi:MAG: N-acetyltransferase family protein [Acidimicrobiales bacterium]